MGKAMKHDVKAYRRPGAVQAALVVLACLALMTLSAYTGYKLLTGQPIGLDVHWLEERL